MKYQNFKEYQQSDEYAFRLLGDTRWEEQGQINFENGTWHRVTAKAQEWGYYFHGVHILVLTASRWHNHITHEYNYKNGSVYIITEEDFNIRLDQLTQYWDIKNDISEL